jgi:hypothetical protein
MTVRFSLWIKYLAAVALGNLLYLRLSPLLPPGARHHSLVDWGTFVDLWFCLFVYGVIELGIFLWRRKCLR